MTVTSLASKGVHYLRIGLAGLAMFQFTIGAPFANAAAQPQPLTPRDSKTTSPIKHVIVIIGENRSFDHVFATYVPKSGQSVSNLLSKGIIKLDANKNAIPGPNFSVAQQLSATDTDSFLLDPPKQEFPNNVLPSPLVGGPSGSAGYFSGSNPCGTTPPISAVQCAELSESGLPGYTYYQDLASGGTGLKSHTPDTRITNVEALPAGPFQLTNGSTFLYNDYAASPVHRFYQMWQQLDCGLEHATPDNPSGCIAKLFSWVEVTVGAGTNGATQAPLCSSDNDALPCFTTNYLPTVPSATTTGEGSTSLAFYNVQQGDAPYFKSLADNYAMSDNFHQSVNGGTGANHIMFGHGDAIWFSDGNGTPAVPPNNKVVYTAPYNGQPNPDEGTVNEVEDPNPAPGTNNWYTEDGYGNSYNAGYPPPYTVPRLRRRLLYRLLGYFTARRSADCELPQLPRHRPALRTGPLLPAQQLQPGLFRQRQQCLYRPESRPTLRLRFHRPRRPASATTSSPTTFPGSTTAISGTTTSTTHTN